MERTETFLLATTCVLELDVISDNFIDWCAFADVLDIFISNTTAHVATLTTLSDLSTEVGMKRIGARISQASNLVNHNA